MMKKKILPTIESAKLDEVYVRKDAYEERSNKINERCISHEKEICNLDKRQRSIEKKITVTLVFVICTLISILTAIGFGIFH